MKPFDFLMLEKLIGADSVNETALALGANRQQVMRWRARGLDNVEASALAEQAGFEPVDVWPELKNGALAPSPPKAAVPPTPPVTPAATSADNNDEFVWSEPPPRHSAGGQPPKRESRLLPLMERPGQWARIAVTEKCGRAHSSASAMRRGKIKVPAGRWEFASRQLPDDPKPGGVWARYLGPDE
jgi:hypothetical protein